MKIVIKRSFERTRQIADFIPVKAACEATYEMEQKAMTKEELEPYLIELSGQLDQFVQSEVEKSLMGYTPCCIRCGGKAIFPKKALNKEGYCGQCVSELSFQAKGFRTDAEKNARTNSPTAPKTPESGKGRNYKEI
jgi:hypothetical protein